MYNTNNNNSRSRAQLVGDILPDRGSFYDGYGQKRAQQRAGKESHTTRGSMSTSRGPPPPYQNPLTASVPDYITSTARERGSGPPSSERGVTKPHHVLGTHRQNLPEEMKHGTSVRRESSQTGGYVPPSSPSLGRGRQLQHSSSGRGGGVNVVNEARQSRDRNRSPALRCSNSFSHGHSQSSSRYRNSKQSGTQYQSKTVEDSILDSSHRLKHELTLSDHSGTLSPQKFPVSMSPNRSTQLTPTVALSNTATTRQSKATSQLFSAGHSNTHIDHASHNVTRSQSQTLRSSLATPSLPSATPTGSGSSSGSRAGSTTTYAQSSSGGVLSHTRHTHPSPHTPPSPHTLPGEGLSGRHQPRIGSRSSPAAASPLSSPSNKTISKTEFPESGGRVGLVNLGNTCFMNSMLQCLGQTGEMARVFLNMDTPPPSKSLVRAYKELMQQMWRATGNSSNMLSWSTLPTALCPRTLKDTFSRRNPQFSGFNQHDSQEFMRFLVSSLHEDLKQPVKTKPSVPTDPIPEQWWEWYRELERSQLLDVFVGQLRSCLTCLACQNCSMTFDPFWELSVSLPRRSSNYSSSRGADSYSTGSSSVSGVDLHDCLKIFTREEKLDGDEKPYCEKCQSLQPGTKKMTIQRLPPVLIIHLKRFSGYGHRSKLDTSVIIPHNLDISSYTSSSSQHHSDAEYELYAVSNHSGTVYFGHYTAWCRHYSSHKWFSYNDSQVSPLTVQTPTFSSSTAYVLFYRQSKKKPPVTKC